MPTAPPDQLLTIAQTARFIGVHEITVRKWLASGRLQAWRIGSRVVRIRLSDIEAAMQPWGAPSGAKAARR